MVEEGEVVFVPVVEVDFEVVVVVVVTGTGGSHPVPAFFPSPMVAFAGQVQLKLPTEFEQDATGTQGDGDSAHSSMSTQLDLSAVNSCPAMQTHSLLRSLFLHWELGIGHVYPWHQLVCGGPGLVVGAAGSSQP